MSRYRLLTGSLCLMAGLCFGDVVLTPAVSLSGYATTGAVAAVQAEVEAATAPKMTMVPTGTTVISTDTTVQVVPTRGIYNLYVQGDSDISFDLSSIDITNNVARWETWIKVFVPGMAIGLPSTNAVQYLETPDLTTTTANELLQVSWQAWMDGTNLMMQGHLYNRNTQMPPPTLADLRTYHYGSPTIEESPDEWFGFDPGTGTITAFNYVEGREDVVIPWEIGGVAVEAIGAQAFSPDYYGTPVETLIGPKTVLSIGDSAFYGCTSFTSVSLPATTWIGLNAFGNCSSLAYVSLYNAISIGSGAFSWCVSLTSVILPNVSSLGGGAFDNSNSQYIYLPKLTAFSGTAFNFAVVTKLALPALTSINGGLWASSIDSLLITNITVLGSGDFGEAYINKIYFGTAVPTGGAEAFFGGYDPNVVIYHPPVEIAPAWIGVNTWGGFPTATYTELP